jgi:hypothetical protein
VFDGDAIGFEAESGEEVLKGGSGGEVGEGARLAVDEEVHTKGTGYRVQGAGGREQETGCTAWLRAAGRRSAEDEGQSEEHTQELEDNAAEGDEGGFQDEGKGEAAEGAEVDFLLGAGVGGGFVVVSGEVRKVER